LPIARSSANGAGRSGLLCSSPAGRPAGCTRSAAHDSFLSYELAWLGNPGRAFLLALGWLWVNARATLADLPPELAPLREGPDRNALEALRARLGRMPAAWAGGAALVLTLGLAATARPANEPDTTPPDISQSQVVSQSWLARPAVADWHFAGRSRPAGRPLAPPFLERDSGGIGWLALRGGPMVLSVDLLGALGRPAGRLPAP
jgi:hypothetical protein